MPLRPAPIVQQEGTDHNDGARNAAKRFVATRRREPPHLQCMSTADRLRAHAPHLETLHAHGLHDIRGVKAGDHASLCEQGQVAEPPGRVTYYERPDRAAGVGHRVRLVHDVPLNASHAEGRVNCIESWESSQNKVQHCSWGTDLRVTPRQVLHRMRGGRARWTIANETFNTLQNQGYNCAHNDGPGVQPLSVLLARLMMLAFVVAQTPQWCWALCRAGWTKRGSQRLQWERRRAWFYDYAFMSMRQLFEALL
jgi:hypothetical protein